MPASNAGRLTIGGLLLLALGAVSWTTPAAADVWPRPRSRPEASEYREEGRRTFVLGGIGFWSGSDLLLANAWGFGAGMRFPVNAWSVVPRVDFEGGSDRVSSAWMIRAGAGGRISTLLGNRITYVEGGAGLGYYETSGWPDGIFAPSGRTVLSGTTPFLVIGGGTTSDPDQRPGFVIETQLVIPAASDGPSVVLIRIGLEF